jgi:hypothetical protein
MTTKKSGSGRSKKLKVRKETIRDLDSKRKRGDVKGGFRPPLTQGCTDTCFVETNCCVIKVPSANCSPTRGCVNR